MASGRGGRWRWIQELVRKNGQGLAGVGGGRGDSRLQWALQPLPTPPQCPRGHKRQGFLWFLSEVLVL